MTEIDINKIEEDFQDGKLTPNQIRAIFGLEPIKKGNGKDDMKGKINYDTMKDAYDGLLRTFVAKNKDYGNSFEKSMDTYGEVASLVRMEDKFNRLKSLIDGDKRAEVASESLSDTLLDLANYAVMTAVYLQWEN